MEWAVASPANAAALAHAQRIWDGAAVDEEKWDVAAGWRILEHGISAPAGRRRLGNAFTRLDRDTRSRRWVMRALAAALVIAASGTLLRMLESRSDAFVPGAVYRTPAGVRQEFALADGTTVMLAPASELRLAADFLRGDRRVRLDGEGMFTVVHDARHPFRVLAGRIVTTDIGTRFDVWHYDSSRAVVSVVEGAVSIAAAKVKRRPGPAPVLTAGQTASAGVANDGLSLTMVDDEGMARTAWTRGNLVFHRAPLDEVAAELSRWYAIDITVDSSLNGEVTLSTSGADRDRVLTTVAELVRGRVVRQGSRFRFTSNRLDQ